VARESVAQQQDVTQPHPGYDAAAQVLQVGDDVALWLDVSVLDELGQVLLRHACAAQQQQQQQRQETNRRMSGFQTPACPVKQVWWEAEGASSVSPGVQNAE